MSEQNAVNDWSSTGQKLGGLCRSFVFSLWASGELGSVKKSAAGAFPPIVRSPTTSPRLESQVIAG